MDKLAPLRDPLLWLVGLAALIVLSAAFQTPYSYDVDIGSPSDRAFVIDGLHDREKDDARTFRWTSERGRVVIPALTAGEWRLTLALNGWQPEGAPRLGLEVNGVELTFKTEPDWQTVRRTINVAAGDLVIDFDTAIFRPSTYGNTDSRALGVRLDSLRLTPVNDPPRVPPFLTYILPLAASVMLIYFAGQRANHKPLYALFVSGVVLVSLSVLISSLRIYLNKQLVHSLLFSAAVGALAVTGGVWALRRVYQRAGITVSRSTLHILTLMSAGLFALKVIGVFYPQLLIFDALFHLHRLELVQTGQLFFVQPTREFANLQSVYPPGMYVFLTPLSWLVPDRLALVKFVPLVVECLGGLVLFWVVVKNHLDTRVALLATFVYLAVPLAFIMYGWGIYANVFVMQLSLLTVAAWYGLPWHKHRAAAIGVFALVSAVALLSHASMLPMLITFWGIAGLLVWLGERASRVRVLQVALALGAAVLIALALYFSVYFDKTLNDLAALNVRAGAQSNEFVRVIGAGLDDPELGLTPVRVTDAAQWLPEGLNYLARESWVYYRTIPILLACIGCVALARRAATRELARFIAAGLATVLIFFAVGAVGNLYARYMLFGAPFIALGAAYMLGWMWQSGRIGRGLVIAGCALLLQQSLWYWTARVLQ